ncbi:GIY-YIG nuclease family protein [Cyclobacterium sp.]|uniref:GIY-YIG nuclease family protein n=1 Tax=Cyclobacterium sp. TaxID=1966343 RepID=UPI0019A096EE|nr:GIY-YIG nuclease family protein [Cyclobacterium sp.]
MNFFVYILYSPSLNRYYVGHTQHIEERIQRLNSDRKKSTKEEFPGKWCMLNQSKTVRMPS